MSGQPFHGDTDPVTGPEAVTFRDIDIEPECIRCSMILGHQAFPAGAGLGDEIDGGGDLEVRRHKRGPGGEGDQTAREVTSQVVLLE